MADVHATQAPAGLHEDLQGIRRREPGDAEQAEDQRSGQRGARSRPQGDAERPLTMRSAAAAEPPDAAHRWVEVLETATAKERIDAVLVLVEGTERLVPGEHTALGVEECDEFRVHATTMPRPPVG